MEGWAQRGRCPQEQDAETQEALCHGGSRGPTSQGLAAGSVSSQPGDRRCLSASSSYGAEGMHFWTLQNGAKAYTRPPSGGSWGRQCGFLSLTEDQKVRAGRGQLGQLGLSFFQ